MSCIDCLQRIAQTPHQEAAYLQGMKLVPAFRAVRPAGRWRRSPACPSSSPCCPRVQRRPRPDHQTSAAIRPLGHIGPITTCCRPGSAALGRQRNPNPSAGTPGHAAASWGRPTKGMISNGSASTGRSLAMNAFSWPRCVNACRARPWCRRVSPRDEGPLVAGLYVEARRWPCTPSARASRRWPYLANLFPAAS